MSSGFVVCFMSGRRDSASSVTMSLPGRCGMVNAKSLMKAHHRWKHGYWALLFLSQAKALESVITLKCTPARKGFKYFRALINDSSSRVCAALLRSAVLKLFERNSIGSQTVVPSSSS